MLSAPAVIMVPVQVVIDTLEVQTDDDRPVRCVTTVENAGGCVLAIVTAVRNEGVVLASSYLADLSPPPVAGSYLLTAPGRPPRVWQHLLERELVGVSLSRACLLDHAAALRGCLEELWDETIGVSVDDDALAHTAQVWAAAGHARH